MRYRLTPEEELANYRKAAALCEEAIKKGLESDKLWIVRNRRIIALMGMFNLGREPKHSSEAAQEAKNVLAMELPAGKDVVARFCLASQKLRLGEVDVEALLETFVGGKPTAPALAAAAILAIQANSETLYRQYKKRFLSVCDPGEPSHWPVLSFMRDRQHNYRLFWANPGRLGYNTQQRYVAKYVISGLSEPSSSSPLVFKTTLTGLDGQTISYPDHTAGKMAGVVFAELPEDVSARNSLMDRVKEYADRFSKADVPVVVAFLTDDAPGLNALVKGADLPYRPAIVPNGIRNPLIRRLGILSADRIPNPYLLRGDGTIIWSISGLTYPIHGGSTVAQAVADSIGINIEKIRTDRAFAVLEKGDFKKSLSLLDERLPPKMDADSWTHDRLHGRALAHMGLKDWQAALADINAAMSRRSKASRWGKGVTAGVVQDHFLKASVLRKLGRDEEAVAEDAQAKKLADWLKGSPYFTPPSYARGGIPVDVYTGLLKRVRLKMEEK